MTKPLVKDCIFGALFLIFGAFSIVSMCIEFNLIYYTYWATLLFCIYCFFAVAALLLFPKLKRIIFSNAMMLALAIMMILLIVIVRFSITPFWEVPYWRYITYSFFDEQTIHIYNPAFAVIMYFIIQKKTATFWDALYALIMPMVYCIYMVADGMTNEDFTYPVFSLWSYPNTFVYILMLAGVFTALLAIAILLIYLNNLSVRKRLKKLEYLHKN